MRDLMRMSKDDIKKLQPYVHHGCLYVACHPGFNVFYDVDMTEKHSISKFVDANIRDILRILDMPDEKFAIKDARTAYIYRISERLFAEEKYMITCIRFLGAYEMLKEAQMLQEIRRHDPLCLVILPSDEPDMVDCKRQYMAYLNAVVGNSKNFLYIESMKYNCGCLQAPCWNLIEKNRLSKHELRKQDKLQQVMNLYAYLPIEKTVLFGGEIGKCLVATQKSLEYCGIEAILDTDTSTGCYEMQEKAILNPKSQDWRASLDQDGIRSLNQTARALSNRRYDLYPLIAVLGKKPADQLAMFECFPEIIAMLNTIKRLYTSAIHGVISETPLLSQNAVFQHPSLLWHLSEENSEASCGRSHLS